MLQLVIYGPASPGHQRGDQVRALSTESLKLFYIGEPRQTLEGHLQGRLSQTDQLEELIHQILDILGEDSTFVVIDQIGERFQAKKG